MNPELSEGINFLQDHNRELIFAMVSAIGLLYAHINHRGFADRLPVYVPLSEENETVVVEQPGEIV